MKLAGALLILAAAGLFAAPPSEPSRSQKDVAPAKQADKSKTAKPGANSTTKRPPDPLEKNTKIQPSKSKMPVDPLEKKINKK